MSNFLETVRTIARHCLPPSVTLDDTIGWQPDAQSLRFPLAMHVHERMTMQLHNPDQLELGALVELLDELGAAAA